MTYYGKAQGYMSDYVLAYSITIVKSSTFLIKCFGFV